MTERSCGGCNLCCKLLPIRDRVELADWPGALPLPTVGGGLIPDFNKPANVRCQYMRHGKGCGIYDRRPISCRVWSCRWLVNDDTAELRRPDHSRYVIDLMPDEITLTDNDTSEHYRFSVVQIWCDPATPRAWDEPALKAYLLRRWKEDGMLAIIRYSEVEGFVVFPPGFFGHDQWVEKHSKVHPTKAEYIKATS